jgi:hypothetical protein
MPAAPTATACGLWKLELARLADEIGVPIHVCHFPRGTSKWNKVEHRLFSAISMNWRGQPLTSYEVIVQLIGATTTTGLKARAELDQNSYPNGIKVTHAQSVQGSQTTAGSRQVSWGLEPPDQTVRLETIST